MQVSSATKKYIVLFALLGGVSVLVYIFVFGDYGAYRIWKQKNEISRLQDRIDELLIKQEVLQKELELLKTDPEYLEKIAREDYGMVKKGEILYKVVPSSTEEHSQQAVKGDESTDEAGR